MFVVYRWVLRADVFCTDRRPKNASYQGPAVPNKHLVNIRFVLLFARRYDSGDKTVAQGSAIASAA
jgi:hypothetical protein